MASCHLFAFCSPLHRFLLPLTSQPGLADVFQSFLTQTGPNPDLPVGPTPTVHEYESPVGMEARGRAGRVHMADPRWDHHSPNGRRLHDNSVGNAGTAFGPVSLLHDANVVIHHEVTRLTAPFVPACPDSFAPGLVGLSRALGLWDVWVPWCWDLPTCS